MQRIIFLDVDGVLCIPPYDGFNEDCLFQLELLVHKTDAKIVISSSRRKEDLKATKEFFPEWMRPYIIGQTIRGYQQVIKGSTLPIERGNEIKEWVDRHLKYPWHAYPERKEEFKVYDENGLFVKMRPNVLFEDYNYVIIDDNDDMLLCQKNHFVQTDSSFGLEFTAYIQALNILQKSNNN